MCCPNLFFENVGKDNFHHDQVVVIMKMTDYVEVSKVMQINCFLFFLIPLHTNRGFGINLWQVDQINDCWYSKKYGHFHIYCLVNIVVTKVKFKN